MITIYKPGVVPVRGLRTSLQGAQLGDGYFQSIDNLRWDTGVLKVRDGIAEVSDEAPSSACLGAWSGSLNGDYYVVTAWAVSGKTQIHSLNLATGAFTEITAAGGTTRPQWGGTGTTAVGTSAGETRLPSVLPINFCVHTRPRKVEGTTVHPPIDYLSISNGTDWPLIYNPAGYKLGMVTYSIYPFHKDIRVPPGGAQFRYYGCFSKFLAVAASSGKTFSNTNATHWKLDHSTVAPYTSGADKCIDLMSATAALNDEAKVAFTTPVGFQCEQLNIVVQPSGAGSAAAVADLLSGTKIQLSADDATYYTIYDPSAGASDPALSIQPIQTVVDSNRTMITLSLKNIPTTGVNLKYIKFIRTAANSLSYTLTILAIAGASQGGGWPGDSEFGIAYADHHSGAESAGIIGASQGFGLIKDAGGPSVVTSGSGTAAGTKFPGNADVLYDYNLIVKNNEYGLIYGGLAGPDSQSYGWASHIDLYQRNAAERELGSDLLYFGSGALYEILTIGGTDHGWAMSAELTSNATLGGTPKGEITLSTASISVGLGDRDKRDPGTPLPSAFNIAMPRAAVVANANRRTFVGAVRSGEGDYVYSDMYFSRVGFPFRFQAVQESEESGSRLTFDGEKVRKLVMSSAAANGASTVYVLTDQTFNALGTAGGFVGSGYDASALGTRVRINSHGTNEPGLVAEHWGVIFYLDQENQLIRFDGGGGRSISRNAVDDLMSTIPSAHRGKARGIFWKDRFYLAFTPAGGSANTKILGWNEVQTEWEFCDSLPQDVMAAEMVRAYDASLAGSGQRLLLFGSTDSKVYAYEEGAAEPGSEVGPAVTLTTREYQSPSMDLLRIGGVHAMIDAHEATLNVDRLYKPRDSRFRTTIDCSDSESKPKAIKTDTRIPVEQTATAKPEEGWSAALSFSGELGAGKTLWRIEADVEGLSKGAPERQ